MEKLFKSRNITFFHIIKSNNEFDSFPTKENDFCVYKNELLKFIFLTSSCRYKQIKNNRIKSIISVIGKLKINRTNKMHLVAKEIEWNLVTGDTK